MQISCHTDIQKLFEVKETGPKQTLYWTSEVYGFGKYIRKYGYYPKKLPILIFTDHSGPCLVEGFYVHEIDTTAPVMMFHSPSRVQRWKNLYNKPCFTLYSPFVFYRKTNKITISSQAKGTLAYPAHTIPELDDLSNMEKYIFELKNLPDKFQPVSVSLHYHDINKGAHKLFLKHGINVYTAGNPHDYSFTKEFYAVLRNFKYATSNEIGSYLFYAVEIGVPFFLYGNKPLYKTNTDTLLAHVALNASKLKDNIFFQLTQMFSSVKDTISLDQKKVVESLLGLNDGISRFRMARLLYSGLISYWYHKYMSMSNFKNNTLKLIKMGKRIAVKTNNTIAWKKTN